MSETSQPQPEPEKAAVVNLSQVNAEQVNAEMARITNSVIENIQAEEVDVQVALAGAIQAKKVVGRRVGVAFLDSEVTHISDALVGAANSEQMVLKAPTGVVSAENLEAENVSSAVLVATNLKATNIRTGLLVSREVHGHVETIFDTRSAIFMGIAFGVVGGLITLAGRLLLRGRK